MEEYDQGSTYPNITIRKKKGRKDIYINHSISHVSSHSFSSLAINLRLQLQPHRTVVRGLHASLTNRLLWLYSWLPTITVTLKSRTPFRLYLSLRYRFVTYTSSIIPVFQTLLTMISRSTHTGFGWFESGYASCRTLRKTKVTLLHTTYFAF